MFPYKKKMNEKEKERGARGVLAKDEEDLLERSVKKSKENLVEDSTMDEAMSETGIIHKLTEKPLSSPVSGFKEGGAHCRQIVSYKDIVLQLNGDNKEDDSDVENWMEIQRREEEEDGEMEEDIPGEQANPLCPVYPYSAKQHREDCKKWRNALIVKLMGKKINNRFLMARLLRLWCLTGKFEVIDLDKRVHPC